MPRIIIFSLHIKMTLSYQGLNDILIGGAYKQNRGGGEKKKRSSPQSGGAPRVTFGRICKFFFFFFFFFFFLGGGGVIIFFLAQQSRPVSYRRLISKTGGRRKQDPHLKVGVLHGSLLAEFVSSFFFFFFGGESLFSYLAQQSRPVSYRRLISKTGGRRKKGPHLKVGVLHGSFRQIL